jgi:hypothetical protein
MVQMFCRYCEIRLDCGDIYEVMKLQNPDKTDEELIKIAGNYGWTPDNRKTFSNETIIQFTNKPQITVCSICKGISPTETLAPKKYYTE